MKQKLPIGLAALALSVAPAHAVFIALDDFQSYTAGSDVDGQGGWTANGDTTFVADPDNPANQVLGSAETSTILTTDVYRTIPTISTTSTGTVFFRARAAATADFVIGASDVAAPNTWDHFEGYMRFSAGSIDVRNGGGPPAFQSVGTYTEDEWYNVWLVLDHTSDTATVYFNQGNGDATTAAGSGGFRVSGGNTVQDDLINLFIRSNDPASIGYIDDIFVDNTGTNLSNPVIPEPGTSLLALIGLAFGLRRRR